MAACLLAKRSGTLVPMATKVIAVTLSFKPTRHPKIVAKSPTMAVRHPIATRDTKKDNHPPQRLVGGMKAKIICQVENEDFYNSDLRNEVMPSNLPSERQEMHYVIH